MALCVMTPGTMRMPPWSAHNWDSHATVSHHIFVRTKYFILLSKVMLMFGG